MNKLEEKLSSLGYNYKKLKTKDGIDSYFSTFKSRAGEPFNIAFILMNDMLNYYVPYRINKSEKYSKEIIEALEMMESRLNLGKFIVTNDYNEIWYNYTQLIESEISENLINETVVLILKDLDIASEEFPSLWDRICMHL